VRLSLLITTVVASALWFASGAVYGLLVWFSVLPVSPKIVFPETIAAYTWQSVAPWNVVLPALSVLAFAGLFASIVLLLNRPGRATFLPVWFAAIGASFLTALIVAIGQTAANWPPMRLAMAPQYIVEALPDAGYWGIVWGWIPAVVAVLLARRAVARVSGAPVSNAPISDAPASEAPDAAAPAPRRASAVPALVAALLVLVAGVGIVASMPAANTANRALYDDTPPAIVEPQPTYTPPPPVPVAPGDFIIPSDWCTTDQLTLLAGGGDAATGHRQFSFSATNVSETACVLEGYPDLAFGNDESGDLGVNVFRGGSFMTEDAGAQPITLQPGGRATTQLGWNANATAGVFATDTVWAAPYPGAVRLPFEQELDITAGSTVAVTAWQLDAG
jgi:hypothetical protein